MDLKSFGARLQTLRKQAGMSQERLVTTLDELARRGPRDDYRVIDATLLSRWETARSQAGRQWKPTRPYVLYLIRLFRDHLSIETAQRWVADAGFQITPSDLQALLGVGIGSSNVADIRPPAHNLPSPLTSFINHDREVSTLIDLLMGINPSTRLVTILGEGGVGKTRLALAAAHIIAQRELLADGVWLVPLAGIDAVSTSDPLAHTRPNTVISALAQSLSFKFSADADPAAQIARFLRKKALLIILDNCEHLVDEVAAVVNLLQHAPQVRLWATSRVLLNCQAEHILPLAGLPLPPVLSPVQSNSSVDGDGLMKVPSMQLFIERAQQHNRTVPQFDAQMMGDVARLCRLVAGSPLALELAANWVGHISVAEMVATLQQHDLSLLATNQRDVPLGHRSMTAVFETSWQLLSPAHQFTLAKLSVFHGIFSREAALAIAGAKIQDLIALVNQSLLGAIQPQGVGSAHYIMHELLREFVALKLTDLEAKVPKGERAARRHSAYYLRLVSERQHEFYGTNASVAIAAVDATLDNVRAAWQWAVDAFEVELITPAWLALRHFFHVRNLYQEGEATFREAALAIQGRQPSSSSSSITTSPSESLVADFLSSQAFFLNQLQRNDQSIEIAKLALTHLPKTGLHSGAVRASLEWGIALSLQGKHDEAIAMLAEAVAQAHALQMPIAEARGLHAMYRNHLAKGDFQQTRAVLETSVALYHESGYTLAEGFVRDASGHVALRQGLLSQALQRYQESLNIYEKAKDQARAVQTQSHLGNIAMLMGDLGQAYAYLRKAHTQQADDPDQRRVASTLERFSQLLGRLGDNAHAFEYAQQALMIGRQINSQTSVADALCVLARLLQQSNKVASALAHYQEALAVVQSSGARSYAGTIWLGIGEALIELNRLEEAQVALETALTLQRDVRQGVPDLLILSALAQVLYAKRKATEAIAFVNDILAAIDKRDYEYAANVPAILWRCYVILQAVGDDRATTVLRFAHQLVQMQAAGIDDEALAQSFLTQVKVNRDIALAHGDLSDPP